jgi:hypothetical protein
VNESAAPTYPATPVDCLLSDLTAIAEMSEDEAMWEDFVERLRQWRLEKEQFVAE